MSLYSCTQFQSTPSLRKVTFLLCTRMLLSRFQSTPSLRKVTEQDLRPRIPDQFQSTPSLRKVTDEDGEIGRLDNISIHTFLAEGDYNAAGLYQNQYLFQSTPSLRKVTLLFDDCLSLLQFQSTPSLRKVTLLFDDCLSLLQFQSTPSLRKVTQSQLGGIVVTPISIHTFLAEGDITDIKQSISNIISIHTFLAEGDSMSSTSPCSRPDFNPHLPRGR